MRIYNDFRNFQDVLKKAKIACEQSGQAISDHFGDVTDMIAVGKGAGRKRAVLQWLIVLDVSLAEELPLFDTSWELFRIGNASPHSKISLQKVASRAIKEVELNWMGQRTNTL